MAIEFFSAAAASPSGASAGMFIPRTALPGVAAGEFANAAATALKESKALMAVWNALYTTLSPTAFVKLGFAVGKSKNSVSADVDSLSYSATVQKYYSDTTKSGGVLPVPTTGTNSGIGDFSILDIFPGATKIAADDAITGEGLVIPTADLTPFGASDHAGLTVAAGSDNRNWFLGLLGFTSASATLRSTTQASAITSRGRSDTSAFSPASAFTDATNPTTGILAADLNKLSFFQHSYSLTIEILLDQVNQTFDVNYVAST